MASQGFPFPQEAFYFIANFTDILAELTSSPSSIAADSNLEEKKKKKRNFMQ